MTRAHVEFIQSQALPWQKGLHGEGRDDVESKILSIDKETGACTVVVRYPPGWAREVPEHLLADEEFLVLDGELTINGRAYTRYCYSYLPAGYLRERASSAKGAAVLTFLEAKPRATEGEPAKGLFDATRLTEFVDTNTLEWVPATHDANLRRGLMGRALRTDPYSNERTWINAALPGNREEGFEGPQETHPVVEEMFLLSGELAGNAGLMLPGAYFWRPPGIRHGPYGSRTGTLMLFRCKDGPLVNYWSDDNVRFTYDPEHKPVLPPEFEPYCARPYAGPETY